jgi:hypothetical protein
MRHCQADIAMTYGHEGLNGLDHTGIADDETAGLLPLHHPLAVRRRRRAGRGVTVR